MIGFVFIISGIAVWSILCVLAKRDMDKHIDGSDNSEEAIEYFDYFTFAEKFQEVRDIGDKLESIEALMSDLDMCDVDSQLAVQISWISNDGKNREYTIMCDGINTSTEALYDISERESFYLRSALSYRCSKLSDVSQGSSHERKIPNGVRKKMDLQSGEWSEDAEETVCDVREDDRSFRWKKKIL